jgi:hypothetical protein
VIKVERRFRDTSMTEMALPGIPFIQPHTVNAFNTRSGGVSRTAYGLLSSIVGSASDVIGFHAFRMSGSPTVFITSADLRVSFVAGTIGLVDLGTMSFLVLLAGKLDTFGVRRLVVDHSLNLGLTIGLIALTVIGVDVFLILHIPLVFILLLTGFAARAIPTRSFGAF